MDQETRNLIAASWAHFAEQVRPGTYDDRNSDVRDALDAVATAAEETAETVRSGQLFSDPS